MPEGRTRAPVPVLGLAPAGVGASFFHPLRRAGAPVQGIDLPGRESRIGERPCGHLACAVDDAAKQVEARLGPEPDSALVLVGHSFGAVIAWQVAVRLAERGRLPARTGLVVSGAPSPLRRRVPLAHLPDTALVATVARLTGYSHPAYEEPRLRAALLPALRSDLACLTEVPALGVPLESDVRVLRGSDDPVVTQADLDGWRLTSRRPVREVVLPGGHMHPVEHPEPYARALREVLDEVARRARVAQPG